MSDKVLNEAYHIVRSVEEATGDDLHDRTIDFLDDALAGLDKNDQYGDKGDMLRYALTRLQEVGLGRD